MKSLSCGVHLLFSRGEVNPLHSSTEAFLVLTTDFPSISFQIGSALGTDNLFKKNQSVHTLSFTYTRTHLIIMLCCTGAVSSTPIAIIYELASNSSSKVSSCEIHLFLITSLMKFYVFKPAVYSTL